MASISAPTSIATFPQPHASTSKLPHVALSPVVGDARSAVAAVQGDGVWTYDLSTLRAATSFTVPPATTFTTSPISYWTTKTKAKAPAANDGGMDVDEPEAGALNLETETLKERVTVVGVGKEIWVWRGEDGEKEVVRIKSQVNALHNIPSSSTPILALTSFSQFYLVDPSTTTAHSIMPSSKGELLTSRIIQGETTRLVLVSVDGKVEVFKVWVEDKIVDRLLEGKVGEGELTGGDISEDGAISVLDKKGNLYSTSIRTLSSTSAPIHLNHPSVAPVVCSLPSASLPLLLVPTSHPNPSLLLTVPSSTLPAIISTSPLSSLTSSGTISALGVISSKHGVYTIGVVLSHKHGESDASVGRSVLYTCEIALPAQGIGMGLLLGTKSKTEEYFSVGGADKKEKKSEEEKKEDRLVEAVNKALRAKDVAGATKAWRNYAASETVFSSRFVKAIVSTILGAALNGEGRPTGVYAVEVARDLVSKGLVNDSMWKESVVVDGLLPLGDWDTITVALSSIKTISSSALVALIRSSITSPNASTTPSTSALLKSILSLPPPGPTYRVDLHQGLTVEEATRVLEVYNTWAAEHVEALSYGLTGWESASPIEGSDLPSLTSLVTHTSSLLDAHLLSFLSHIPSHETLSQLQSSLDPLLAAQNEYRQLRGPVEALLTLSRREAKKSEERAQKKGRKGKKAGKDEGKLPEENVGKWKVEDLVF
ncbi:hypothetical protein L202_01379 [Cryptococcus amylolentus CBS 6039]|uniref:Uncharacterized protein n=1 Tax=Cryptococcus amylolentus CBS 6039 TaxID=1295533 RepID=A0A1E3I5W2_9TREE|nr:hypothetical protein L202_01379 [Cryptococcus amylolentus CBS 6039]ODN83191.1 hypothetical protein L202_01379 [Cryptococcus amylolentus CBS 6039]